MTNDLNAALQHQVLSIFDQQGCPIDWPELASFIRQSSKIGIRELGHQTYLIADSGFDPQTYGLNQSYVVMLTLDATLNLTALNVSTSAAAA